MSTRQLGFTIVEIMIVIGIIGILAAIAFVNFGDAKQRSRIARTTEELTNIKLALDLYRNENGVMPPAGANYCSLCQMRPIPIGTEPTWGWETAVLVDMRTKLPTNLPARDPWGNHYGYDNNFLVTTATVPSIVCSRGPNGILETWTTAALITTQRVAQGDDLCIFITESDDI